MVVPWSTTQECLSFKLQSISIIHTHPKSTLWKIGMRLVTTPKSRFVWFWSEIGLKSRMRTERSFISDCGFDFCICSCFVSVCWWRWRNSNCIRTKCFQFRFDCWNFWYWRRGDREKERWCHLESTLWWRSLDLQWAHIHCVHMCPAAVRMDAAVCVKAVHATSYGKNFILDFLAFSLFYEVWVFVVFIIRANLLGDDVLGCLRKWIFLALEFDVFLLFLIF